MSVSDATSVNAAVTNAGFMDKNEDTFTVGEVALQNPLPTSGTNVDNVQKELNSEASYTGKTLNTAKDDLPAWVDSTVGLPTDNLQQRSDKLTTASTTNTTNIAVNAGDIFTNAGGISQNVLDIADNTQEAADIRTTQGTSLGDLNLGSFPGAIISDNVAVKTALTELETSIESLVTGLSYQGTWNADTNTPALASSVGSTGFYYVVSVAGVTNLDGITDWGVGDWAIFSDSGVWQKLDNSDQIGANQELSNLTSPTAINQHLKPDSDNSRDLGDGASLNWRDLFASGIAYVDGGLTAAGNGIAKLFSQDQVTDTGDVSIFTGNSSGGQSGDITLTIGTASAGPPASEISNPSGGGGQHFSSNLTTYKYANTFSTVSAFQLSSIAVGLKTTAAATGQAVMEVWGVTGGNLPDPGNVIAISTNTLDLSTLTTSFSTETWNFSNQNLFGATRYCYVVRDNGFATTGSIGFEDGAAVASESYYYDNPPWTTGGGIDGTYEIFSASAAIKGNIALKDGSEGIIGQVWTSTDALGKGQWSQPSGGSGAGGINYLKDDSFDFESGTLGDWVQYYDGAVAVPTSGASGSPPAQNFIISAAGVVRGVYSGEVLTVGNAQGGGVRVDFAIDNADKSSSLYANFDYSFFASGATTISDYVVYVYNVDTPTMTKVTGNLGGGRFTGVFYTTATDTNYRLLIHHAGTETDNTQLNIDNIQIGPDKLIDFSSDGPIGQLMDFPVNLVPDKFLYCDGTQQSRTTYADLFAVIGTQFGVGDGSTTFNLPDYRNAFFRGDSGGRLAGTTEADATAPNGLAINGGGHEHTRNFNQANNNPGNNPVGFLNVGAAFTQSTTGGGAHSHGLTGDTETRPANTAVKRCIRYAKGVSGVLSTTQTLNLSGKARYHQTAAQSIPVALNAFISYPIKSWGDIDSNITTTPWRYTANKSEVISVDAGLLLTNSTLWSPSAEFRISIYKNGAIYSVGQRVTGLPAGSSILASSTASGLVILDVGDYVEIGAYQTSGAAINTYSSGSANAFNFVNVNQILDLSVYSIYGKTEVVESFASPSIAYPFGANVWGDLTSIDLTVGEWDITYRGRIGTGGTSSTHNQNYFVGTVAGNNTTGRILGLNATGETVSGAFNSPASVMPRYTVNVTQDTTFYLKTVSTAVPTNYVLVEYTLNARKVK